MNQEKKIKLSPKEYEVMETIRREGKWLPPNSQNATAKNLMKKGLCDWNGAYSHIVFTDKGKLLEL